MDGTTPDAPTRILDAAENLIIARGVAAMTLEAVAREAGVSKGGLLYHFASREAWLEALLGRLAGFIAQEFAACVATQPEGPGRVARSMLEWGFGEGEMACNERHQRAGAVFLAAFHHDPALLAPMRAVIAQMRAAVAADGLPPWPMARRSWRRGSGCSWRGSSASTRLVPEEYGTNARGTFGALGGRP
jgi:AcrR family transcriptional regulator